MDKPMNGVLTVWLTRAAVVGLFALNFFEVSACQGRLPSDSAAREYFEKHRPAFVRFAELLEKDPGPERILPNGQVEPLTPGRSARVVPEYRNLMHEINAQEVFIRPNGSFEFQLWGFGCAVCSDSFKGVRYLSPSTNSVKPSHSWEPVEVRSLEYSELPKEKGQVADGLYVIPIDSRWALFRLEISD